MVFLGGAVLADIMKDRENFWMTREEYQEKGIKVGNDFDVVFIFLCNT